MKSRIELEHDEPKNEILEEMILAGESQFAEFKSTLRFDLRQNAVNKKLEHVIAKTIAGFLKYDGKEICWVEVSKSGRPVFITSEGNDEFFIRAGCSSQPLSREEQSLYERQHWGK